MISSWLARVHILFEEADPVRSIPAGKIDVAVTPAVPDRLLVGGDLQHLMAVCIDDERVAVRQALAHTALESEEGHVILSGTAPGNGLGRRIELEHARGGGAAAEVIEDQQ